MAVTVIYEVTAAGCDKTPEGVKFAFQTEDGNTHVFPVTDKTGQALRDMLNKSLSQIKVAEVQLPGGIDESPNSAA